MTPIVAAESNQPNSMSLGPSMRYAAVLCRRASSTNRCEFDEFADPTTKTTSHWRTMAATAR